MHRDGQAPAAEAPDLHRAGAHLPEWSVSDASDDALPDARGAADLRRAPSGAGAEKLAVPALVARARAAWFLRVRRFARSASPALGAELCIPDAAPSAEQSCAVRAAAADPKRRVVSGAEHSREAAVMRTPSPEAPLAKAAAPSGLQAVQAAA